jgi:hypothetical protein
LRHAVRAPAPVIGSGIDKDRPDYTVVTGEWEVGRIYETRGGPDNLRWFWSMTVNGPNFRSAGQPGRRGRSWRLEALRMCPEPNAEKCQEEPQRLQNRQLALYESRRHRLRGQRISKRLVKDQKARPPARLAHAAPGRLVARVSPDQRSDCSMCSGPMVIEIIFATSLRSVR